MPLSMQALEDIRADAFADDIPIPAEAMMWTAEQAEHFFLNGGIDSAKPAVATRTPSRSQTDVYIIVKNRPDARVGIALDDRVGYGTIITRLTAGGLAEVSGLRVGMRVLSVNRVPVKNFDQGANLIKMASGSVEVLVSSERPAPLTTRAETAAEAADRRLALELQRTEDEAVAASGHGISIATSQFSSMSVALNAHQRHMTLSGTSVRNGGIGSSSSGSYGGGSYGSSTCGGSGTGFRGATSSSAGNFAGALVDGLGGTLGSSVNAPALSADEMEALEMERAIALSLESERKANAKRLAKEAKRAEALRLKKEEEWRRAEEERKAREMAALRERSAAHERARGERDAAEKAAAQQAAEERATKEKAAAERERAERSAALEAAAKAAREGSGNGAAGGGFAATFRGGERGSSQHSAASQHGPVDINDPLMTSTHVADHVASHAQTSTGSVGGRSNYASSSSSWAVAAPPGPDAPSAAGTTSASMAASASASGSAALAAWAANEESLADALREAIGDTSAIAKAAESAAGIRVGEWANCELLQPLLSALLPEAECEAGGILVLDIATAQLLKLADADQQCEAVIDGPQCAKMRERMRSARLILAVLNDNDDAEAANGGEHWSVVSMARSQWVDGTLVLEHADPSGDAELNCDAAQQFASALAERLSEIRDLAADRIEVRRVSAPIQHDAAVCGLTSLAYAKAIVADALSMDGTARRAANSEGGGFRERAGAREDGKGAEGGGDGGGGVRGIGWGEVEALRRVAARVLAPARLEEALVFARELGNRGFTSRVCGPAQHVVFDLYDEEGDSEGFDELEEGAKSDQIAGVIGGGVSSGIDGPMYDFLQAVGMASLGAPLGRASAVTSAGESRGRNGWSLEGAVKALQADRTAFLQQLKDGGVEKLVDRQALANAIAKALRAGWLRPPYRGPFTEAGRALRIAREAQPNAAAPQLTPRVPGGHFYGR